MNSKMGGQGRPETCALLALEYFHTLGLVRRFKEQPFKTTSDEFGAEICPDFLVELPDEHLLVLEIKTERFITHALQQKLDRNRAKFAEFGLRYLVWSDKHPLNHATRHHLIQLRKFAGENIPSEETTGLARFVGEKRAVSFEEIYQAGFDLGCFYAAASQGKIFAPLSEPFSPSTKVTAWRQENLESIFLDCKRSSNEWWSSL